MKLNEVLKEVADPGKHPEISWPQFLEAFRKYVLKCLVYPSSEDRREFKTTIDDLMMATDTFYDRSLDDVYEAFKKDDIDDLQTAVITSLINSTHIIIKQAERGSFGLPSLDLKSTIDHADPLPIPQRDLKALIEVGCKGYYKWTEQKVKYDSYIAKKGYIEKSATLQHLIADIKHEVMHSFADAMEHKFTELKKDRHPHENWCFEDITRAEVDKFNDYKDMLAWLSSHRGKSRSNIHNDLYKNMLQWVVVGRLPTFAAHDVEVKDAAHHMWNDPAFLKAVLKQVTPFFEQQLKDAEQHGR